MSTNYKSNDADPNSIIQLSLTLRQIRLLDKLVSEELSAVEYGESKTDEKSLQSLIDAFFDHVHERKSEAERVQEQKAFLADVEAVEKDWFNAPSSLGTLPCADAQEGLQAFSIEVEVQDA